MAVKRHIPEALRQQARQRAEGRCEYCLLHEDDAVFSHEADHIVAERHGGQTTLENLAWACAICNRLKGSDLSSIDPETGRLAPLFHPRRQRWQRHFRLNGGQIEGIIASGRATTQLLQFNSDTRVEIRLGLIAIGHYLGR